MPSPDKCHASEEARLKLASLDEKEKGIINQSDEAIMVLLPNRD